MTGHVDGRNCPLLTVMVRGPYGTEAVTAVIDTGFSGYICLTAGIIGSERFHRMRSFAGDLLSKSFLCGEDPTGANADSHRIEIAIVAYVSP